jgi:homospermidine synthase
MIQFGDTRKIIIMGVGGVGKCVAWYLPKFFKLNYSQVYLIDKDAETKDFPAVQECIKKGAHFVHMKIEYKNIARIFDKVVGVKEGDVVIDVTTRTATVKLFTECRKRQLFYFNTDTYTESDNEKLCTDLNKCLIDSSIYFMQINMRDAALKTRRHGNITNILECGMNPGLISVFVKQGIMDIARWVLKKQAEGAGEGAGSKKRVDKELAGFVRKRAYSDICKKLMIRTIHCSELDTQRSDHEAELLKKKTLVNTWSCLGFIDEGCEPCEMALGTHETVMPVKESAFTHIVKQVGIIAKEGRKIKFKSYVPTHIKEDGTAEFTEIQGVCVHHGEGLTLNEFIATEDYAPTMHYVYNASPAIENIIHTKSKEELYKLSLDTANWKVLNMYEDKIKGTDNVGAMFILEENPITHEAKPWGWWTGSVLTTDYTQSVLKDPYFGPTVIQVMAGLLGGLSWSLKNPGEGVVTAEAMDTAYIMGLVKKYLGVFYSGQVTGVNIAGYDIDSLMVVGRDGKHKTKISVV